MPEDLFLQLLMKHSPTKLRELRAEAEAKIKQGQLEAFYIDQALEKKGSAQPTRTGTHAPAAVRKAAPKPGSTREPITRIVKSDPARTWLPSEVRDELQRSGLDIKTNTVRATMKRLLDEGVFVRPQPGQNGFKLASSNGSGRESNEDQTTSAAGGYEPQGVLPASKDGSE